jgi:hypothetical protein
MGIDRVEPAKITVQKLSNEFAEESVVVRESDLFYGDFLLRERSRKHFNLGTLPGPVNPFNNNEFSARRHRFPQVYHTGRTTSEASR